MNIKELLKKKEKVEYLDLNEEINKYLRWYEENINYNKNTVENLITKIAVWYELRYPDYEINKIFPYTKYFESDKSIYVYDKEEKDDIKFSEFYTAHKFFSSLPLEEKRFLKKARYNSLIYIVPGSAHVHVTRNGFINECEYLTLNTMGRIKDEEVEGKNVKELQKLFKDRKINFVHNGESVPNELDLAIKSYDNWNLNREKILDCAMYKIIQRGGAKVGSRRGFLFAKEFNRDLSIPMMYSYNVFDYYLSYLINEYIKCGGKTDIDCYTNYFSKENDEDIRIIKFTDLMKIHNEVKEIYGINDNKYTKEQLELYKKFITAIKNKVDSQEVKKENIKRLRIERKLNKQRSNSKIDN